MRANNEVECDTLGASCLQGLVGRVDAPAATVKYQLLSFFADSGKFLRKRYVSIATYDQRIDNICLFDRGLECGG